MRLAKVEVTNVKGIEHIVFEAGVLTVLSGENGCGKTSVIDAIANVFEGGHDPGLIRRGADRAEVVITLDNGTTITKRITPKGSDLSILTGEGLVISKPQSFVDTLASSFAFDPLAFIGAPKKERAAFLLEAMPISFDPAEIKAATGRDLSRSLSLEELDQLRAGIYNERSDLNRSVRDLDGHINQLRESLGEDDEQDWELTCAATEGHLNDKRGQMASIQSQLDAEAERLRGEIRKEYQAEVDAARVEFERLVAAAEAARDQAIEAAGKTRDQHLEDLARQAKQLYDDRTIELQAEVAQLAGQLGEARAKREQQVRNAGTRKTLETMGAERKTKGLAAIRLSSSIEALDKLKTDKLAEQPVEGVEIRDGEVYVDGIAFDHINTQRQYMLAFQIASLKLGKLALMVCDRAEALDPEQWAIFCEAARESGVQVIAARVEPQPLEVGGDGRLFKDDGRYSDPSDTKPTRRRKQPVGGV